MDKADLLGFVGVERAAGEEQFHGATGTDEGHEAGGPTPAGGDGVANLSKVEGSVITSEAKVAGGEDFTAAAEGIAIYGGDDGDGELGELVEGAAHDTIKAGTIIAGEVVLELFEVAASSERLVTGTGDDEGAEVRVLLGLGNGRGKRFLGGPVKGVADFGAIEAENGDIVFIGCELD